MDSTTGTGFYVRQTSGLVREIGLGGHVIINIAAVSIPLGMLVATQAPFAFPGANIVLVILFTALLSVIPTALYGMLGTAMPRSGGDYVFLSRILHPAIGFVGSFSLMMWYALFVSQFASLIAPFGLAASLATVGLATDNNGLIDIAGTVSGQSWQFWMGAATLVVVALLMSFSLRAWIRILGVLLGVSLVGAVVALLLTIVHSRADFQAALAGFGVEYDQVLSAAREAGYEGGAQLNWANTLTAAPLAFASFGYSILTAYSGGEVRSPQRTLLKGLLLSLAIGAAFILLMTFFAARTFGQDFMGSITYLSIVAPDQYPLPAPPYYILFSAMLTQSTFLIALIGLSFALSFFLALAVTFLVITRSLFAWSFDRVVPSRVSDVNPRTHSPLVANAIILVVLLVLLVLVVYGPSQFVSLIYTAGAGNLLTLILVAVAGALFRQRRRQLFDQSPLGRSRLLGLPAMTLIGVLSIGVYLFMLIPLLTNDALGANATEGLIAMVVIPAVGALIYAISYGINRARGVNLGLAFQELPPE